MTSGVQALVTRRTYLSKENVLKLSKKGETTWIDGRSTGADTRVHGTTKRQVAAMFAEAKPALLPLPVEPFRYYQYGERAVHMDGCV
jgi:hypothetical protein